MAFLLLIVCGIACYTDLRYRIIPNKLTFPIILFAPALWAAISGWNGAVASITGILLGMFLLIVPALLGGMGGGDLKLLMAIGAIGGPTFTMNVFIYMCMAGGIAGIIMLAYKGKLAGTLKSILLSAWWLLVSRGKMKLAVTPTKLTMPYALCITAGAIGAMLYPFIRGGFLSG